MGLKDSDLDEAEGSLTIRESKFGSSRAIALLPDVVDGIRRYQALRDGIVRKPKTSQMIVTTGGRPLSQDSAEGMFSEIRWTLLGRGETFAGRMPRLHDARYPNPCGIQTFLWTPSGKAPKGLDSVWRAS